VGLYAKQAQNSTVTAKKEQKSFVPNIFIKLEVGDPKKKGRDSGN